MAPGLGYDAAVPFRNFTLDELARHLGLDARDLARWAQRGRMPGKMVNNEWRFNRAEMIDWLQREMHSLDPVDIRRLDAAMSVADGLIVTRRIPNLGVELNLAARSPDSVVRELAKLAERTGLVYDPEGLLIALQDREASRSTALPGGIAFPHPHKPMAWAFAESFVCVARIPSGVPYSAPDGKLTYLFLLVCSADEREHLGLLARLARMFHEGTLADELFGATTADDALASIERAEAQAIGRVR